MIAAIVSAGLKYGIPAVGALYAFLAHRQSKKNHAAITQQK
jgi:hypothetical protein